MSYDTLAYIDNIVNSTQIDNDITNDITNKIAGIFHDTWRISWGNKNGASKYTDIPYYVNNMENVKTNVNVSYEKLPVQFTELNKKLIMFTLKMISKHITDRNLCYHLINEYRRIIYTPSRGSPSDVIFNNLPYKEKQKCIDIYNLCRKY